ncbi:hypothetical protein C8R42DRAFT_356023 [Lentinula raphanica]|nr:hypothetical protein C8R42DRAFT_356023 [Lentinula raphanica]
MEGNKLQKNNHKISLSGPIRFQRVRHDGDDVRKAEQAHQRDEVALIGVRTEGLWEPVYDQAAKKWIVNWRSDMNISPTKSHLLGNVKFQKDVSEVSVRKIMGLSADDPLELMYEVVSIVAKSGGFECDQEGYMAWMVWYMQMSDMKQLGQTKWIGVKSSNERPEKQRSSPSPGPLQGSSTLASTHDSSSPGSARGSPKPGSTGELASMHDSSHPGAVHSSAQSSKTAKSSSHSRPNVPDSNEPTEPTYDSSFSKLEEYYSRSGYPNGLYPGN